MTVEIHGSRDSIRARYQAHANQYVKTELINRTLQGDYNNKLTTGIPLGNYGCAPGTGMYGCSFGIGQTPVPPAVMDFGTGFTIGGVIGKAFNAIFGNKS